MHCFTGCDTVSSFHGKSKTKAFKLLVNDADPHAIFHEMGSSFKVSDELVKGAEKFVCKLYGQNCGTVSEARYNLFLTTTKSETNLPPSADSLKKHELRANYKAAVHSKCLEQFPQCPSPKGHGWKIVEGELAIDWGDLPPAPSSLLELTHCSCKKTSCEKSTTRTLLMSTAWCAMYRVV